MKTITVELLNDKALKLLQYLEDLNLLRLVKKEETSSSPSQRQWAGSISVDTASQMLENLKQSREEWERNT